jgi:hypothetical protein
LTEGSSAGSYLPFSFSLPMPRSGLPFCREFNAQEIGQVVAEQTQSGGPCRLTEFAKIGSGISSVDWQALCPSGSTKVLDHKKK